MICKKCNKYEIISRSECKVCGFKGRRKKDIDKVLNKKFWTIEELEIIISSLLYENVKSINEILPLIPNKTLGDLIGLLRYQMIIRGTTKVRVMIKCHICNKEIIKAISYAENERNYCSTKCRDVFRSNYFKGKNSPFYKQINVSCTNCNKDFTVPPYDYDKTNKYGDNHNFCCQKCYWEYRSKYYVKEKNINYGIKLDKERLLKMSIITTKMIRDGMFPQTLSKPHIIINNTLNQLKIPYKNEFNLKYQCLDIYIKDYNLGIEIMGDYWHGSPIKYEYQNLNKTQLKDIKQDKRKHTYTKKYYNFEILYLWELDIKSNIKLCEYLIKYYIFNNGILKDYNSFNYILVNDKLKLKKNITNPYFLI